MSGLLIALGLSSTMAFYAIAVFASLAIELAALLRDLAANDSYLPDRYKRWSFPVVRALFAFYAAGPLAIILGAATDLASFYIGATAPLIFDRAAAGIKENGADSSDG